MKKTRWLSLVSLSIFLVSVSPARAVDAGFGEADISPKIPGKRVYIAGFGHNRLATSVLDPLAVRAFVLRDGDTKIAFACADVVGLFYPSVERIRKQLPGFAHITVSSTHNHHGPDTMGLWGPSAVQSGVDAEYLKFVEAQVVEAIRQAEKALKPVTPKIGMVKAPELLHDARKPIVLLDELVVLDLRPAGIVVQWNCHPETLDSKNEKISSDFVGTTVQKLKVKAGCPIAYFSGALGGLMTSMHVDIKDPAGNILREGSQEKTLRYGELLANRAEEALAAAQPLSISPMEVRSKTLAMPVYNPLYRLGKKLGVLDRDMEPWSGDPYKLLPPNPQAANENPAIRTEVSYVRLGDLDVAVIPGEIYPELVVGKIQDPVESGADFPDAPLEPSIYSHLRGKHRMMIGLGNDEIGYILPKRQWDEKSPYAYGAQKAPYGEINSCGPETGPIICKAFADLFLMKK